MFSVSINTFAAICFTSSISFLENSLDNVENILCWEISCPDFDIIDREQVKFTGDFTCYFDIQKFNPFITECEDVNGILYSCYYKNCKDEYDEMNEKRCQTLVLECTKKNKNKVKSREITNTNTISLSSNKKNKDETYKKLVNITKNEVMKNIYHGEKGGPLPSSLDFILKQHPNDKISLENDNFSMIQSSDKLISNESHNKKEIIENFLKLKKYIYSPFCQIIFACIIYITLFILCINMNIGQFFQNRIDN